jgi:heme exporter protein A
MIRLNQVSFHRDYKMILNNINLTIGQGELIGILGPNGAGKTTLLHLIVGVLKPNQGSIGYEFSTSNDPIEIRRNVGVVLEDSFLYDELSVRENLEFFSSLYHVTKPKEREERIKELLHIFQMEHRAEERISTLSKGLKKRVSLMRGILHQPALWLLDEPFDGLDQESFNILSTQMLHHVQAGGSVILISHSKEHIFRLATRGILLDDGKIKVDCPLPEDEQKLKDYYESKSVGSESRFKERDRQHALP